MMESVRGKKSGGKLAKFAVLASVAAALIIAGFASRIAPLYGAADSQPVAGIPCERQEYSTFHIHVHLDIFVDGKPYPVPESVGIVGRSCLYWIHTHDSSGIIHVEAPQQRYFTLDQFFAIWKATADTAPAVKQKPKVFVNVKPVNGGLEKVEMTDLAEIAVVYGKEPPKIPQTFEWPETYRKEYFPKKPS
ncbi:MAG TPA: hypothetical protein VGL11_14010 [Candidatus Binatia bacterium]